MAMMAVPQDGNMFDVFPKNGLKPLMLNKYDGVESCFGYLDPVNSVIDEGMGKMYLSIYGKNTLSNVAIGDEIGIYAGGYPILGEYQTMEYGGETLDAIMIDLGPEEYDAYLNMLELGAPAANIPVWIIRDYSAPENAAEETSTPASTTTIEGTTTAASADRAMVMDYYVDWSGGMDIRPVPTTELIPFSDDETVSRQYLVMDEVCQWRKLCNATGISLNMDTANHKASITMATGIATTGKTSIVEPQYWLLDLDNDVYLRVYLNIHEINYKMLGKYQLNAGQGHNNLYFRDPSVYGDLDIIPAATTADGGEYWDAEYTITTPPGAALWADFWEKLEAVAGTDVEFTGEFHVMTYSADEWYPCTLEYSAGTWLIKFDAPEDMLSDTDVWGDVKVTGMEITKTVTTALPYAEAEYVTVTFGEGDDDLLNKLDVYSVTFWGLSHTLWWSTDDLQWVMDTTEVGSPDITISSYIMSLDSVDFSTEAGSSNIFQIDNAIYPEALYYFRMQCIWQDIICRTAGCDSWIKEADVYVVDGDHRLPSRYGIYALSHYSVDEHGNQSRMPEYDAAGNTRYCGIYGRNYLCKLADLYPYGLSLYPHGTEFSSYYPPYTLQTLITRANTGVYNAVGYSLSANTITFDLSEQMLGTTREAETYAYYDLQLHPDGSTLHISHKQPGYAGNGFTIEIIMTGKVEADAVVVTAPVDNVLNIFIPEYDEMDPDTETTLSDIYSAIMARTVIDYKVTATLTGTGTETNDVITGDMTLILSGGADELVVTNHPSMRDIEDVYMHPGFMLNSSRRQSPINLVGIHAVYLSGNYAYANGNIDVMAIDTGAGIDLYALLYAGEDRDRYTLAQDIWPTTENYEDAELVQSYASCELPTEGTAATLTALVEGWQGNGITFAIERVSDEVWIASGWGEEEKFYYEESIPNRRGTLYVHLDELGVPLGTLAPADLETLMLGSELMGISYTTADNVPVDDKILSLSGGGGVATGNYLYVHKDGHLVGLEATATPGLLKVDNGYSAEERYLFEGEEVDLLAYKLQNAILGKITDESRHTDPGEENMWDIPNAGDYAELCAMIDERVTLDMINYIDVGGRELAISAIVYGDETFTITTDDAGSSIIASALPAGKELTCSINDIYYSPAMQQNSITKAMVYYGKYMSKITVQIPDIGEWGPTLVPYYIVQLVYRTVMI